MGSKGGENAKKENQIEVFARKDSIRWEAGREHNRLCGKLGRSRRARQIESNTGREAYRDLTPKGRERNGSARASVSDY